MADQDQKFFDTFNVVIGSLVGIAIGIFILALFTGGSTQREGRLQDEAYQLALQERIAPAGRVRLPGDKAGAAEPAAVEPAAPVEAVMSGPQVYNAACVACHGNGIGGAPRLGDAPAWTARIAQGLETLQRHAIEGYQGDQGYMPPKGGRVDLSDEAVLAAVDFMLEESS